FSSRRRHTRFSRDWSSDVCSSDLAQADPADGTVLAALSYVGSDTADALLAAMTGQTESRLRERIVRLGQAGILHGREFAHPLFKIGRASCRERVEFAVRDVTLENR